MECILASGLGLLGLFCLWRLAKALVDGLESGCEERGHKWQHDSHYDHEAHLLFLGKYCQRCQLEIRTMKGVTSQGFIVQTETTDDKGTKTTWELTEHHTGTKTIREHRDY